jgi:hypothetical protein
MSRQNRDFSISIEISRSSRLTFWNCRDFLDRRDWYFLGVEIEISIEITSRQIETPRLKNDARNVAKILYETNLVSNFCLSVKQKIVSIYYKHLKLAFHYQFYLWELELDCDEQIYCQMQYLPFGQNANAARMKSSRSNFFCKKSKKHTNLAQSATYCLMRQH